MFNNFQNASQTNIWFNNLIKSSSLEEFNKNLESLDKNELDEDIIVNRLHELKDVVEKWNPTVLDKNNISIALTYNSVITNYDINHTLFCYLLKIQSSISDYNKFFRPIKKKFQLFYIEKKLQKMPSYTTLIQKLTKIRLCFKLINNIFLMYFENTLLNEYNNDNDYYSHYAKFLHDFLDKIKDIESEYKYWNKIIMFILEKDYSVDLIKNIIEEEIKSIKPKSFNYS